MKFFKKRTRSKIVDDTENIVYDFRLRAPFWAYRTVDYQEYAPFVNYRIDIDHYLEKLFEGEIDSGNKGVLDEIIQDMSMQAILNLKKQKADHIDKINNFSLRRCGDKEGYARQLALLHCALERTNGQHQEIGQRYQACKFRQGGPKNENNKSAQ